MSDPIHPSGQPRKPPKVPEEESGQAKQASSKGGQIKLTHPKITFPNPFKWLIVKFQNKEGKEKTTKIERIKRKTLNKAWNKQLNLKKINVLFSSFVQPALESKQLEDLQLFSDFLDEHPAGAEVLFIHLHSPSEFSEVKEQISESVNGMIKTMKMYPDRVPKVLDTYIRIGKLMQKELSPKDYLSYLQTIIQAAASIPDEAQFKEYIENPINEFLSKIEDVSNFQNINFFLNNTENIDSNIEEIRDLLQKPLEAFKAIEQKPESRLKPLFENLVDHTILSNRKLNEEATKLIVPYFESKVRDNPETFISDKLKDIFIAHAKEKGFSDIDAVKLFDKQIQPSLSSIFTEVKNFLAQHGFLEKLDSIKDTNPDLHSKIINSTMQAYLNGNLGKLEKAFTLLPRVGSIIDRLRPEDEFSYLEIWIENAAELNKEAFSELFDKYAAHLNKIEAVQAQKPQTFDQDSFERQDLMSSFDEVRMNPSYGTQAQRLLLFDLVMRDATVVENRQILQYSIAGYYMGATQNNPENVRSIPFLGVRASTSIGTPSFGLCNQLNIPFVLPEGQDDQLFKNFKAKTEVFITDPFTMETRAVRVPLPISGDLTNGAIKKQLQLLEEVLGTGEKQFDSTFKRLELPEDQKEHLKEAFLKFDKEIGNAFAKALGDFNQTESRSRFANALEKPEAANALNDDGSVEKATKAAALQDIFLLKDNSLSLLPQKLAEQHQDIATFSKKELDNAMNILNEEAQDMKIQLPEGKKGTLTLNIQTEYLDKERVEGGIPCLTIETTIKLDGKTNTRKTYYDLQEVVEGETKRLTEEEVKQRIIDSRLFERDLLLAKAAFLEKIVEG